MIWVYVAKKRISRFYLDLFLKSENEDRDKCAGDKITLKPPVGENAVPHLLNTLVYI
jgi:hypothetical protein